MVKNLSIFFPLYNEEGNVREDVKKAVKVLEELNLEYEIILIDDGSKDKTGEIAEQIAKENPRVRVIHHQKNLGYGEALKSGFYNAKYDTIVYTDGDGQFDFSEVDKFLEKISDLPAGRQGHDLVIGYRIKRKDPFFRILFKRGWKLSLLTFFGLTFKDVDCGFKMVRRKVLEKIPRLESTRGAMINAELVIKAKKYGFKVGQVGVNHYPRLSGKPTGASLKVITRSYLDLLKLWWKLKDQKSLFVVLVLILILASFLRFYRLDEYMTFLGDEGRDAIIVKDIITFKNFPLIGPPTSVGNIYLGPLYYYMMAASMVFTLSPVAAAGMDALIGVLTVYLIYYLSKAWFGKVSGLIAAYLYAISPVTIIYSRSSWNPNPTPFFSLLAILGLYKARTSGNYLWLILTGICAAAALQMHYLALILLPILGVSWIKELLYLKRLTEGKFFWRGTILGIISFLLLMSPLLIFDLKHDFLNYKAVTSLLTNRESVGFNILETLSKIAPIYNNNLVGRYITGEVLILTPAISILILLPIFWTGILMYRKKDFNWGLWMLNNWLLIGILGLTFYKNEIYDHYLNFLNPAPFLLLGSLISFNFGKYKKWILTGMVILVSVLTIVNFDKSPLKDPPNNQLKRTQEVARFIIAQSQNRSFNFALLAQNNYDSAYQFYLDQYGHKPKKLPLEKTSQLFVVCEDKVCDPIYSPKYEIAAFGWTLVEKRWEVNGLTVYKLVQNPKEFQ